jgi:D-alanine transaminase
MRTEDVENSEKNQVPRKMPFNQRIITDGFCLMTVILQNRVRRFVESRREIGYIGNENFTDWEKTMIVYLNGSFLEKEKALVSVEDRAFLFADAVYEVIRCYDGRIFRLADHLRRLEQSVQAMRIKFSDFKGIGEVGKSLVEQNRLTKGDALIYVEISRGAAPRMHTFPPAGIKPTVYVTAVEFHAKANQLEKGIAVILVPDIRWTRCDVKTVALTPNVLMAQRALDEDAEDAIFVRDGVAIEGTANNVFGVFSGTVTTHPNTNLTLGGITRDVVLELCGSSGIPSREAPILESQLPEAEELFVTSTTMEITPVVKVNGRAVGNGVPGPITRRIQQGFRQLVESFKD